MHHWWAATIALCRFPLSARVVYGLSRSVVNVENCSAATKDTVTVVICSGMPAGRVASADSKAI